MGDKGVGGKKSHEERRRDPETAGSLQVSWLPSAPPLPATGEEATGLGGVGEGVRPLRGYRELKVGNGA